MMTPREPSLFAPPEPVAAIEELSGWLLPCGRWCPTREWWHVAALYDLQEAGVEVLQAPEIIEILKEGEEGRIRECVANVGLVKISRRCLDGIKLTAKQLQTLQHLVELCDLDAQFELISGQTTETRHVTVRRLLKIKNPSALWSTSS